MLKVDVSNVGTCKTTLAGIPFLTIRSTAASLGFVANRLWHMGQSKQQSASNLGVGKSAISM